MLKYGEMLENHCRELNDLLKESIEKNKEVIIEISGKIINSFRNGGKVIIFGNGGSYADALHFAGELEGSYRNRNRRPLPVLVPSNSATLTAIGNDFGYDKIFLNFVKAHAKKEDIVIGISTSGNSENVIKAMEEARRLGAFCVVFAGNSGGSLKNHCDLLLDIPSKDTPRIQEAYHFVFHEICDIVEKEIFSNSESKMIDGELGGIIISGEPCAGKSEILKKLCKEKDLKIFSAGKIFREKYENYLVKSGENIVFDEFWPYKTTIEENSDADKLVRVEAEKGKIAIDSRFAPIFCQDLPLLIVYLGADFNTRVHRAMKSGKYNGKSFLEIADYLKKREENELEVCKKIYGIDYRDKEFYDLIIDSTELELDLVYDKIVEKMSGAREMINSRVVRNKIVK